MRKLAVITEKESVARDIVAVLGGFESKKDSFESDQFVILWAIGHILSLPAPEDIDPKYKRWTLDTLPILPEKFDLKPLDKMKGRIDGMAKVFKRDDVEGIVNACDAGREGELIFREIIEYTGADKPILRLWLQSMTSDSIREGFKKLEKGEKYEGLAAAAWCRSEADWLVGMNSTRAVTRRLTSRKTREVWSAGRVQTPTLSLLVNHEYRILEFDPRPYWQIQAKFQAPTHEYDSTWYDPKWEGNTEEGEKEERIFDKARAEAVLRQIEGKSALASETRKPARESAPLPFDLTSLQREANRRFSYSARRTLQAAQRLYERYKVLTYPRTDSKHLPEDYHDHVDRVLQTFSDVQPWGPHAQRLLDQGLENQKKIFDSSKVSDHFAIIPTGTVPKDLEGDDFKIFDLVTRRFLASFHPQAVWNQVERITQVGDETFRVRSRTLQVPGWREAMGADEETGDRLPPLVEGLDEADNVSVHALGYEIQEKVTNPPTRITEARLLGLMERAGKDLEDEELSEAMGDKGLGTPATRAEIIEGLISRGYVQRIRGGLKPTAKGIRLIDFLHRIDSAGLTSAELTGEWEKHLNEVEHGQMRRSEFMEGISGFTRDVVEKIKNFEYDDLYAKDPPVGVCPKHPESPVVEFFWGYRCSYNDRNGSDKENGKENGKPECDFIIWKDVFGRYIDRKTASRGKENGKPECDFIIWKDVFGRYIDRKTASRLLEKRETPQLPGFVDQRGQEYEASLILNDNFQVQVSGSGGSLSSEEEVVGRFGNCPCGQGDCEVTETTLRYVCERLREGGSAKAKDVGSCGFVFPKLVCKREISLEEAREYLENGRTAVLEGFISKRGRPFPAILYRKENGRHGFEFLPREKKTATKKTTKKKTAKKKAVKKVAKKKVPS